MPTYLIVLFGMVAFWLLCGFIARAIVRSNYDHLPYPVFPHSENRKDLLPLMWAQQWTRSAFREGPIGLGKVLWRRIAKPYGEDGFKLGFSLKPLPRYYGPR